MYSSYYMTANGPGVVYATDQGIVKVDIPDLSQHKTDQHVELPEVEPSELTVRVALLLQRYFQGERIDFGDIPVVLDSLTRFRRNVLLVIRSIPYGTICSYGQVACECGSPHAARAVGGALAANPIPIIIPCHRVAGSGGHLTGFSAPGGEGTKMALLKMEGVEFKGVQVVTNQVVINRIPCR